MLEDETVACPFCNKELNVKVSRFGKNTTYIVSDDCPNCKAVSSKIETSLNRSNKRSYVKVEKSYIKTDPRG